MGNTKDDAWVSTLRGWKIIVLILTCVIQEDDQVCWGEGVTDFW